MTGPYFSIPCFFQQDGRVDYRAITKYCEEIAQLDSVHTLYAMAYNTRYRQLSYDELVNVNKIVCEVANKNSIRAVVGHPYTITTAGLRDYCKEIAALRPYAVSVLFPERYYGLDEVLLEFMSIPNEYGIGIMIHEQKLVSGFNGSLINWPDNLLQKALDLPGVVCIKEDSKDDSITGKVLSLVDQDKIEVVVAGGGKRRVRKLVQEFGLKNWLNGSFLMFPFLADKYTEAYLNLNFELMDEFEQFIEIPLFDGLVKHYGWHTTHKAVLHVLGYCELAERAPMSVISAETLDSIKPKIQDILANAKKLVG